ncbi:MAG: hypothetical protein Q9181_001202 [Wetmoreana brouardii]
MGLVFKISFTSADAPELLQGVQRSDSGFLGNLDLVAQARVIFLGIALFCTDIFLLGGDKPSGGESAHTDVRKETRQSQRATQLVPLHGILSLFLITQSRVTNVPLFALFEIQMQTLAPMSLSPGEISLTSIILQYTSFFALGGSNGISSIDLSNAYNGVSGYNVAAVGILTFCSNWAGPIWWSFATMIFLARTQWDRDSGSRNFYLSSTAFVANATLFVMLACTALRTHLFVWTVFSPKYLYTVAWSVGQHLCVDMAAVGCFLWLGNS